jgi:ABC-type transporter lipoprotein component MlaA/pimeloyl-ACP methyl ester carboxylesterase
MLLLCLPLAGWAQRPPANPTNAPPAQRIVLPKSVPDPIEPVNRVMWDFNKGLMKDVIEPTSRVYRFAVGKPVRTAIGYFGTNLNYPDRVINNLLQGKWIGARDETSRFLCNTIVGLGGFFDVADKWKIPKSDADFGQTFGQWGWQPHFYLMLPFFGQSNDRDAVGLGADSACNPLLYISPYEFVLDDPLTYLGPYSYFTYSVMYNNLAETVDDYVRYSQAEMDPYAEIQYAWTFARANRVANFQVKGKQDPSSLETLESVFFAYKDPHFPNYGKTRSVLIPSTGRKLKFTYWLQPGKAQVVYIIPGLGSHRLADTSVALAEMIYNQGYTAVSVSSPFNSEFMEEASTAALPAFVPVDGHDMHVALTEIDRYLNGHFPGRLGARTLMGYSMGAIDALYIAATERTNPPALMTFDRYVAINTPVRLLHGVSKLDDFYDAPLAWPAAERTSDMENTFLKVAELSKSALTPRTSLPFNAIESKFLIGLSFRFILRDIIFSSQRRHNQGILQHPIRKLRREPVYREILQYSFADYIGTFAAAYYRGRGMASPGQTLGHAGDLRTYEAGLRGNPKIRAIVNENDFLLTAPDLEWLRATFGPEQLTVFKEGGHLGNLSNLEVQKAIMGYLGGL